jgi:hypothetical protein
VLAVYIFVENPRAFCIKGRYLKSFNIIRILFSENDPQTRMATPHPGDNAAAQHLKGIDRLNNNYKRFAEKIKTLKGSPNVNQRDLTDLKDALDK